MQQIYIHKEIEKKWQEKWLKEKTSHADNDSKKPKQYVLIEFPYPSGEGLHMGHLRPYLAGDIYSRLMRMQGNNTLYPIGWDAFGLPAENYAIKKGVHPRVSTAQNIANAKKQLQSWGMGFDWDREVNTTDPEYYKWTQWIFLQLYKAGLAYEATGLINWCPKDKTGLANEEVIDGKCDRCGTVVEKKEMKQWYLKITEYADKLLAGLDTLNWPDQVKLQQKNWIGKSEGAEIEFEVQMEPKPNYLILHGKHGSSKDRFIPWLKKNLEKSGFQVQAPDMPNTENPNDDEQTEFVLENCKIDNNTIILGHSFGGLVAMRILEHGKKIKGVVFAGTPMSGVFLDGKPRVTVAAAINKGFKFDLIKKNSDFFKILVDSTDLIVRKQDGDILSEKLGYPKEVFAGTSPHFGGKEEPVILQALSSNIKVFTTRPDTIFGATYIVLAPEHPLVEQITTTEQKSYVTSYVTSSRSKSDLERTNLDKEKTGIFTGAYAINPATKNKIPIWIADYVLGNYGTGAIMAVPAHDERDFEFAKKYRLPIKKVIKPTSVVNEPVTPASSGVFGMVPGQNEIEADCWIGDGELMNSGKYDGQASEKAREKMAKGFGAPKVQYKLRDWVFSRQRYWGEPIPLIHCEKCGIVPVPDDELPVTLPEVEKYEPTGTGESPLAAIESWVNTKCPKCDGAAKRETDTMPQWAGSSWYWIRYTDHDNTKELASKKIQKYWTPVDVYFGGMEHTTLHLLYARFWNLFLYDHKIATAQEPFLKRVTHGIILGPDGEKMSKSRGNVVNPDDIVGEYGADTLRMFEPFLGPHEATVPWNDQGIIGVKRFLDKVWRFGQVFESGTENNSIHKLTKKITSDIQNYKFNTAIAAFMEFLNENKEMSKENWQTFLILLAPFAPHITEELWHQMGHKDSIHLEPWPKYDEKSLQDETVTVVVQVLGRLRASLRIPAGASQEEVKEAALSDPNVRKHLEGKEIIKEVFVQDKLINLVIR